LVEEPEKSLPYLGFWFIEDEKNETLSREVLTIWDIFAEAGGLVEIVYIFSLLILGDYQSFNFLA